MGRVGIRSCRPQVVEVLGEPLSPGDGTLLGQRLERIVRGVVPDPGDGGVVVVGVEEPGGLVETDGACDLAGSRGRVGAEPRHHDRDVVGGRRVADGHRHRAVAAEGGRLVGDQVALDGYAR